MMVFDRVVTKVRWCCVGWVEMVVVLGGVVMRGCWCWVEWC